MNPLTAHYKDGAVGSLNRLSALVFLGFPRIGFSSLGTSDSRLVIQPVMFYSFFLSLRRSPKLFGLQGKAWLFVGSALKELKWLAKVWHHENKFEAW